MTGGTATRYSAGSSVYDVENKVLRTMHRILTALLSGLVCVFVCLVKAVRKPGFSSPNSPSARRNLASRPNLSATQLLFESQNSLTTPPRCFYTRAQLFTRVNGSQFHPAQCRKTTRPGIECTARTISAIFTESPSGKWLIRHARLNI